MNELSDRELEVLALMARGMQGREIALELHISHQTVKHHCTSIYKKLGVRNRTEAVVKYLTEAER